MSRMDVMCKFAYDVALDDSHGYTQGTGRMGPTDYDCAGLCITAAKKAGYPTGGATYTGDMIPTMTSAGWTKLPYSRATLKRGDMEIRPKTATRGGHVALCIDDQTSPKTLVEAYMNEKGGAIGGKPGDQTGNEIRVHGDYGFGTYILRPPADPKPAPKPVPKPKPKPKPNRPDEGKPMSMLGGAQVYRAYNKWSGEHLLTTDEAEYKKLVDGGWESEGVAFASVDCVPIYRLYNKWNNGDHILTADIAEANKMIDAGWVFEGLAMVGVKEGGAPVYRLYNKYTGQHMFTVSEAERDELVANGWTSEGIGWRAPVAA